MDPSNDENGSEDEQDDGAFWFGGDYFSDDEGDESTSSATDTGWSTSLNHLDIKDVMARIGQRQESDNPDKDYQERARLVNAHMGSMALCRGERGEWLRESGAIDALLGTLMEIRKYLPPPTKATPNTTAIVLAAACCGAIRDLACGSAANRSAVRDFSCNDTQGLLLLARYLALYDGVSWQDIASSDHLALLTNIIGALRNLTHSTPLNCVDLHDYGVTSMLSWRLLHSQKGLPDTTQPWREAAFRAGGTLINMSEKCSDCATQCARDPALIRILIECWGGTATKKASTHLLHLGLAAILQCAKEEVHYDKDWDDILNKEQERKRTAQRKEEERKQSMLLSNK